MSVSVGATCRSGYVTAGASGALGGPVGRACRGVKLLLPIANPVNEKRVIATLRAEGAADIEQAHGEWRDGDWADFGPVAARRLVENASN